MAEVQNAANLLHHILVLLAAIRLEDLRWTKDSTPPILQELCCGAGIGLFAHNAHVVLREAIQKVSHTEALIVHVPDVEAIRQHLLTKPRRSLS